MPERPAFIIVILTAEKIVADYQAAYDKRQSPEGFRYEQQHRHTGAKAEQHQPAHALHTILRFSNYIPILCRHPRNYSVLDMSSAIFWAVSTASGEISSSKPFPPINLFTKSGTISKIFVIAS